MTLKNLRFIFDPLFRFAEANDMVSAPGNGNQSNVLALSKQKFMKESMLLLVTLFIFTSVTLMAQSPQKINFQSIVRNTNGLIISNKTISIKVSLLSDSITGTQVYSESHAIKTDAIGLVSLQIGSGTALSGSFATINWGNAAHFIKLEADFNGGNNYVLLGTQELMSVPYAMYASKTDTASLNLTNRFAEKAPINNPEFTGQVYGIDKSMVGLGNVDNTSDASKPVSVATQTALNTKAPINNPEFTGQVYGIDKSMVGLGNVDNTSDVSKPVSGATQTALNTKAPKNNPEFTGQVYGIDKNMVGLGNVDNTSDASKPVSSATQTALNEKAPKNNPEFTGQVYGIDKNMVGLGNVDNTSDASKPISGATQTALNTKVNISDTMTMLANYKAAIDTKLNKSDFPSGDIANEILYWNGTKWVSLPPGTTGQVLIMSSTGLSWGCMITNTAATASSSPTLLVNTALPTPITIATTGATGIDTIASGLPAGVTAVWSANVITISGTPSADGTFTYTIRLTGGCGNVNATGTITVTCVTNTAAKPSSSPTLEAGKPLTNITIATTGATGIDTTASGLPAGVTASWSGNVITISGTPTAEGTFNYTFSLTGGCGSVNATGTITVTAATPACPNPTISYNNFTYTTVGIGSQCWMKENLRVTTYNDGTNIPDGTSNSSWGNLTTGASSNYNEVTGLPSGETYVSTYGYLYNWYAAKGIATAGSTTYKNICPTGWHVPTDSDWNKLVIYLDSGADTSSSTSSTQSSTAGLKMKSTDTSYWSSGDEGTNSSKFSALPGGGRDLDGSFGGIRYVALFWSVTEGPNFYPWNRSLSSSIGDVGRANTDKSLGFSIRCLKD
jgi:uncharacterized protein (TIGR02145 family)